MIYRLLIVAATLIWGSSFVIVKDVTAFVSPAWILTIRFIAAAIILAIVFLKKRKLYFKREYVLYGSLFGLVLFAAYYIQTIGLMYTTPGKNAFLTGTYCVIVPFMAWFFSKRKPNRFNIVAALLAVLGIGLVSLNGSDGFTMGMGDLLTLICAVFYAVHICLVAKYSQGRDIYVLTMWQFAAAGVCALIAGLVFEVPPVWMELSSDVWLSLVYLAIGCTTLALLFQNIGQAHLAPSSAALLLSLESVFGVVFSVALGAEALTISVVIGFAAIFIAIVISETQLEFLRRKKRPNVSD